MHETKEAVISFACAVNSVEAVFFKKSVFSKSVATYNSSPAYISLYLLFCNFHKLPLRRIGRFTIKFSEDLSEIFY